MTTYALRNTQYESTINFDHLTYTYPGSNGKTGY
jgi:hypothetical protein